MGVGGIGIMDGRQMKRFCDALSEAFNENSLTQLLKFHLNKNLVQLVPPGDLNTVVFNLTALASQEGWLGDLIVRASEERPRNLELQSIQSEHRQEVLTAKLAHVEDKVNEQQKIINKLVETSMSASAFRHLAGITLLREYKYRQNITVRNFVQREFYYLKDRGFIGPAMLEFDESLNGQNVADKAVPTETGLLYLTLRKDDVPKEWLDPAKRANLKVDVARKLGLQVPEVG
jgi:hypothetical protein